jgi:hypothetical protein
VHYGIARARFGDSEVWFTPRAWFFVRDQAKEEPAVHLSDLPGRVFRKLHAGSVCIYNLARRHIDFGDYDLPHTAHPDTDHQLRRSSRPHLNWVQNRENSEKIDGIALWGRSVIADILASST